MLIKELIAKLAVHPPGADVRISIAESPHEDTVFEPGLVTVGCGDHVVFVICRNLEDESEV